LTGFLLPLGFSGANSGGDLERVLDGLERRYASVETAAGHFRQTYRAPGVEQVESGVFWLKKPVYMRWEYREPEEKLFVTDGREAFLHVPRDRQVTVQPFRVPDMRGTPLELLLGMENVRKSFTASWEYEHAPKTEAALHIRLTPRARDADYDYLVLELDAGTFDIRRLVIRERTGNTSEFLLTGVRTNMRIDGGKFRFRIPEGTEVLRQSGGERLEGPGH
jgi:outer membrane lipoprotein carrier protein